MGGGVVIGFTSDCDKGHGVFGYACLALAVVVLLYYIEIMTSLLSKTSVEGRPLVRMIASGKFLDNYHILVGFALLDLAGKLTRAEFVGRALHCSSSFDTRLYESVERSPVAFLAQVVHFFGFGGVSLLSMIIGPVVIQGSFMLFSFAEVRQGLQAARNDRMGVSGLSMGVNMLLDDYGALADWALLKPAAKVFSLAAVPLHIEDISDATRLWERLRVEATKTAVNLIPDNVFQVCLMARFFAFKFDQTSNLAKAQLIFSMFCSTGSAMKSALDLMSKGIRFTLAIGVCIVVLFVDPFARIVAAFECESHIFSLTAWSCTDV